MIRWLPALLVIAATVSADKLDTAVRNAARRAVKRFEQWALQAEAAELEASASGAYRRILELDPDHRRARQRLKFTRSLGRWTRTPAAQAEVEARKDADAVLAKQYAEALALLEEEYIVDLVRVCDRFGTAAGKRRVLLPLLERMPRRADLHEALGHVRIGNSFVRPELEPVVRATPRRVAAWRAFGALEVPTTAVDSGPAVPGVDGVTFARTGEHVVGTLANPQRLAVLVGRTHALLTALLGKDAPRWRASPIVFLAPKAYTAMVKALHPEPDAFRLMHRFDNYEHASYYAFRLHREADAGERYGHAAAYYTMLAAVAEPEQWPRAPHAWLLEGFAYLVTFELHGTGNLSFVSIEESSAKATYTRPPPAQRTRAACLDWVREQVVARRAYPLSDVFARSLNNLDPCASLQAYSFLRFLFLRDPARAARLPALLASKRTGPQAQRVARALEEATGRPLAALEAEWRAFVREIDSAWGYD